LTRITGFNGFNGFIPSWPEARPKGYHSPLAMGTSVSGIRPVADYPAHPACPVKSLFI